MEPGHTDTISDLEAADARSNPFHRADYFVARYRRKVREQ
jgi:hypothetical protein